MTGKPYNISRQTLAYELVKERLAQQIESVKNLDIKASIVLAIIGVIFTGYLQAVVKGVGSGWFHAITLLLLTFAAIYAVRTFVQMDKNDWRNDPDPEKLLDIVTGPDFQDYSEEEITDYILQSMSASYEHNKNLYMKRYGFLYKSLLLILIAVIIIGIQVVPERSNKWRTRHPSQAHHQSQSPVNRYHP